MRAAFISFVVFLLFSVYLYLRRGYYDVYIINKVLGSTAVVVAGLTLLAGPLRRIRFITPLMTIRRQLGLTAFGLVVFHVIFSLFQMERFEWFSWYIEEWIPVTFGIIAVIAWICMVYISRDSKIVSLGADRWKKWLSFLGKLAFLAIFLHLVILKYPGWIRWFTGQTRQTPELLNPSYPPASLFVFLIMLVIILYRIYCDFLRKK